MTNSVFTGRYWVFFAEEEISSTELDRRLDEAASQLTTRSIDRRRKVIHREPPIRKCDLAPDPERIAALETSGCEVVYILRYLNAVSVRVSQKTLPEIEQFDFVAGIKPVMAFPIEGNLSLFEDDSESGIQLEKPSARRDDPDTYGQSWTQSALVNIPLAHEAGYLGSDVLIGVQDAGFDNLNHNCFRFMDIIATYDFLNDDDNVADEGDIGFGRHGTRTLSVIAGLDSGSFVGAAPQAQYVLTKTENSESEQPFEEDVWVAGLWFHDSLGVDVLSSSLSYRAWYDYEDMDGNQAVTTIAADSAAAAGMVIVNSMGNTGLDNYPISKLGAPADGRMVIGVGGVISDSSRWRSSSQGPSYDGRIKPDVSALSSGVYTASNFSDVVYLPHNGTSFSCPIVAGVAALVLQANPDLTPTQVIDILHQTSSHFESPDTLIGYGIVNALAAVRRAEAMSVNGPALPCSEFSITAFPNPFNGTVIIQLQPEITHFLLELYDHSGRRIPLNTCHSGYIGKVPLNLPPLPNGQYFLRVQTGRTFTCLPITLIK